MILNKTWVFINSMLVTFVCYVLHISFSPFPSVLRKRQPGCPQALAAEKPFALFFLLSFKMEDIKAVHINIASPGPTYCAYTTPQRYNTGLSSPTKVSSMLGEGSDVSRTAQPWQILTLSKGCLSPAKTKQFCVK